jgi:hypothetical protein
MIRKILLVAGLVILAFTGNITAQTATLSPYSRFGPGDMIFTGYAHQQAMGGTSIADYGVGKLNYANPATYAYDTLTIFEFGFQGEFGQIAQNDERINKNNANFSYLTFGLPLKRDRWGLSFGLIPYAATGYQIESTRVLDSNGAYTSSFTGDGGYNRYFIGTGFKIGKHLTAGANFSYLFGTVNTTSRVEFDNFTFFDTRYKEENRLADFYYELGLHWQQPLKNNYQLSLGLTGSPAVPIKTFSTVEWVNYSSGNAGVESVRDTIIYKVDEKGTTTLPMYVGFGASLAKGRKWVLLADAVYQDWSTYESPAGRDSLANSFRISAGGRITPDDKSLEFFNRVQYRAGFYYNQTFLDLRSTQLNDFGITAGLGLPLRKSYQSMINFTIQAGQRGTLDNSLLRERYLRLQFGVTLNEDWFRKRKYD